MSTISRRDAVKILAATAAIPALAACSPAPTMPAPPTERAAARSPLSKVPTVNPILSTQKLGFPWVTLDPFLFCVHHDDKYPKGNEVMGPDASLAGRNIGQDFEGKDGWRMYHGDVVPGFPQHPHRGFETVTVVRTGLLDHSDSLGATARFGDGDLQWLTAGRGILHSEMFPLLKSDQDNPVELFQIWLNLPARDKFAEPHFSMLWDESIPRLSTRDADGKETHLTLFAGAHAGHEPQKPPPASWASRPEADLAIWSIKVDAGATFELPVAQPGTNRMLYFFLGKGLAINGTAVADYHGAQLRPDVPTRLVATSGAIELLLLQGRPIGEPVARYGPFVMNTHEEIQQAFADYRKTQFGGWRWPSDGPVHPRAEGRFARHADGRIERPA